MKENYIEEYKKYYKNIIKIFCPYFKEDVYFTSKGFNHLIYKGDRKRRTEKEIKIRLESLKYIKEIISNSGTLQEKDFKDEKDFFYAFIAIIEDKKYKVVVSSNLENKYIFRSIIPRWKTSKRDKNLS